MKILTACFACLLAVLLTGCASEKNKPIGQRGWIGGQYTLAKRSSALLILKADAGVDASLPKSLSPARKSAIRVLYLATNTPASVAGVRAGDFIVDLNDQPVTSLQGFCRVIDHSHPGDKVALNIYRDGQFTNFTVAVGCEKFKAGGYLNFCFPTVVHNWDLWPNPGFSLVVLGYEPNPGQRHELNRNARKDIVYDQEWCAFLGFLEISKGKRIVEQDPFGG